MDNSYFIFTDSKPIKIKRFHICTWEFRNNTALIEFGFEILADSLKRESALDVILFVPWYDSKCVKKDFYPKLKDADNSRFIFNNSIKNTNRLDSSTSEVGIIHEFSENGQLCLLPVDLEDHGENQIKIHIDLSRYQKYNAESLPNVYVRFSLTPSVSYISTRKRGISKSTILYDIKLNEKRNIPTRAIRELGNKAFCDIDSCFCFNIVPNSYDLVFFDSTSIQNVRTLEYDSFNKYLGDKRIKKDELIVIFNKKKKDNPFSFFAIYSKERIGGGQYAVAILINFICGIFLFIPSYRNSFHPELGFKEVWFSLPLEIYLAFAISILTISIFSWPFIITTAKKIAFKLKR